MCSNSRSLTLILLMWRTGRAPNNTSKWQMEFNSAFKGLNRFKNTYIFNKCALILYDVFYSQILNNKFRPVFRPIFWVMFLLEEYNRG
jgi:hypothetical protein